MVRSEVTEEELNSEIELLQSEDVLRQVVLSNGLDQRKSLREYVFGPMSPEKRIAKATARLQDALQIEPIKKSDLISVTYTSQDPQLAARVLRTSRRRLAFKSTSQCTPRRGRFSSLMKRPNAIRKT